MTNKISDMQKVIIINHFNDVKRFLIIGEKNGYVTLLPVGVFFQSLKSNKKTIKIKKNEITDCTNVNGNGAIVCLRRDI